MDYQLQEKERLRLQAEADEAQKLAVLTKGKRPIDMFIDMPSNEMKADDGTKTSGSKLPGEAKTPPVGEEDNAFPGKLTFGSIPSGAVVPKDSGLSRTSRSSISLTSLNRHGLKLDLSGIALDPAGNLSALPTGKDGLQGDRVASPVTLAPKSARPRPGNEDEFPSLDFGDMGMDGMDAFLASDPSMNMVDLTNVPPGSALDSIDDLFGDNEMGMGSALGDAPATAIDIDATTSLSGPAMDSLFSAGTNSLFSTSQTHAEPNMTSQTNDGLGGSSFGLSTEPTSSSDGLFMELGLASSNENAQSLSTQGASGLAQGRNIFPYSANSSGLPSGIRNVNAAQMGARLGIMHAQQNQHQLHPLGLNLSVPIVNQGFSFDSNQLQSLGSTSNDNKPQDMSFNLLQGLGDDGSLGDFGLGSSSGVTQPQAGDASATSDFDFDIFGTQGAGDETSGGDEALNFSSLFNLGGEDKTRQA